MAIEGVAQQLEKILNDYVEQVDKTCDEVMDDVAKDTAEDLRHTSPKREKSGKYARSWTVSKIDGRFVVHNKKYYRLTHLLNNGHVVRPTPTHPGKKTRVNGDNHIGIAEERANRKLIAKLEQKL